MVSGSIFLFSKEELDLFAHYKRESSHVFSGAMGKSGCPWRAEQSWE